MKTRFLCSILCVSALTITACSRKTTPSTSSTGNKNVNAQIVYGDKNNNNNNNTPVTPGIPDSATPVPVTNERVLIILDRGGRLTYSSKNVPAYVLAANKALPNHQPVTPAQRSNMLARHKTVLPQALYVPDAMSAKSGKGQYYKYQNKFWYWKKSDGFYYLDETYYQ